VVGLDPILERLPPETFSIIGASATGGEGLTARASAANAATSAWSLQPIESQRFTSRRGG